jgi:hypothetical protein
MRGTRQMGVFQQPLKEVRRGWEKREDW